MPTLWSNVIGCSETVCYPELMFRLSLFKNALFFYLSVNRLIVHFLFWHAHSLIRAPGAYGPYENGIVDGGGIEKTTA